MILVTLTILAPIPVGHHVTVIPLETRSMFTGNEWVPTRAVIATDDDTHIVYAGRGVGSDDMTYESIHFPPESHVRIAHRQQPLRGRVTSCVVRTENGDTVEMSTVLGIEPDPMR